MSGFVRILSTATTETSSSTLVATMTAAMSAGNQIVVVCKSSGSKLITGFADSHGNTYTVDGTFTPTGPAVGLCSCLTPGTVLGIGDTVTMTISAATTSKGMVVAEYSGLVTLDQTGTNGTTSSVTAGTVAATGATTSPGEVAIVGFATGTGSGAFTATAPFTGRANDTAFYSHLLDQSGLGFGTTVSAAFTWGGATTYAAVIATYAPAPQTFVPTITLVST